MTHSTEPGEADFAQAYPRAYAAVIYARRGWRVVPVHWVDDHGRCSCQAGQSPDLPPCASAGKHPRGDSWTTSATSDPTELTRIFSQHPRANVGIATGIASGIFVLDVDEGVRHDGTFKQGLESLISLIGEYGDLPETYAVKTGGGGTQYYFRMPGSLKIKNAVRAFGEQYPDIDVKGDDGMVVAPPSVSGRGPYEVEQDHDVAPAPEWLLKLLDEHGITSPVEVPDIPDTPAGIIAPSSPAPSWVATSVAAKLDAVRLAPDGEGNNTINRMSYMIGQYVPHGWISREDAERQLNEAVQTWEHPHPQAAYTIRHALDDGIAHPYQSLATVAAGGQMSDAVLAERICGELLARRFCWAFGMDWLGWDGRVWSMCSDVDVIEAVRKHLVTEVQAALPRVADNAVARKALASLLSRSKITSIVTLARGIVQVRPDAFDSHPDLLNTPNGVVALANGAITEHDPSLYLMKITNVKYRPGATHPDWDAALEAVPEDAREWMRVRMGQAITGHTPPDDSLLVLQGTGENGKTTFLIGIMQALGSYHIMVPNQAMTGRTDDVHALMPFMGARLAVVEELPEGRRLNTTRLKETVGTPIMTGRYMYKNPITWAATHSLMLTTNYIPTVNETDRGTWRRLKMIKFPFAYVKPGKPVTIETERRGDPQLKFRVQYGEEQREAALAWVVEGAKRWYGSGRAMPEDPARVEEDTVAWRAEADLILAYLKGRLEPDHTSHVISTELMGDFKSWLRMTGHTTEWSDKLIGMRFGSHEEIIKRRIMKREIARQEGLSRPVSIKDLPAPKRYTAWFGVRFKDPEA